MARFIGRLRISRSKEESTSIPRQRELIVTWADTHGHVIVGWAIDDGVSGTVDPFDTPGLGPWLTEQRVDEYDGIVGWKLDRFSRRAIATHKLFGFMVEHDKTLVCISDNIDLSTWVGRMVAGVIAGVAEGELEAIQERTRASYDKLIRSGRFPGGTVPYGFRKVKASPGWKLDLRAEHVAVIHRCVREILGGRSVAHVVDGLNRDGILSAKGKKWSAGPLWQILTNPLLLGYATRGRSGADKHTAYEIVRDENGDPVKYAPAMLSRDEWDQLQAALNERRSPERKRTRDASPLLGVVKCAVCDGSLTHLNHYAKGWRYYRCRASHPGYKQLPAELLEKAIVDHLIDEIGDQEVKEREWIPASDHTAELAEAREAVEELTAVLIGIKSDTARATITRQIAAQDSKIQTLEQLPVREGHWNHKGTGTLWRDRIQTADVEERRELLVRSGIKAWASLRGVRSDSGAWQLDIQVPEDILGRMD